MVASSATGDGTRDGTRETEIDTNMGK